MRRAVRRFAVRGRTGFAILAGGALLAAVTALLLVQGERPGPPGGAEATPPEPSPAPEPLPVAPAPRKEVRTEAVVARRSPKTWWDFRIPPAPAGRSDVPPWHVPRLPLRVSVLDP